MFGLKVLFERRVIVEMVVGEIGEHGGYEGQSVYPVLVQSVRRYLHRQLCHASVPQALQRLLQPNRTGGGKTFLANRRSLSVKRTQGPDGACVPSLIQQMPNQRHSGRFSVCPRHPDDVELLPGVPEPFRRCQRDGYTTVPNQDLRDGQIAPP